MCFLASHAAIHTPDADVFTERLLELTPGHLVSELVICLISENQVITLHPPSDTAMWLPLVLAHQVLHNLCCTLIPDLLSGSVCGGRGGWGAAPSLCHYQADSPPRENIPPPAPFQLVEPFVFHSILEASERPSLNMVTSAL